MTKYHPVWGGVATTQRDRDKEYSPNPDPILPNPPEDPEAVMWADYAYFKEAGALGTFYDKYPFMRPPRNIDREIRRGMVEDQAKLDALGRRDADRREAMARAWKEPSGEQQPRSNESARTGRGGR